MTENSDYYDKLLKDLLRSVTPPSENETLKSLFDKRIAELKISSTNAAKIINIERKALKGILDGTSRMVDFNNFIKLSNFLQIHRDIIIQLFVKSMEPTSASEIGLSSEVIEFIKDNFDLAAFKKAGFIESITDFVSIEKTITSYFGLKNILEYRKPKVHVAFSAGKIKPKNELARSSWIKTAADTFKELNNPNSYDREALIKYFPDIRWHSMNIESGLPNVIQHLYKMGVTVIYQFPLAPLHLRGATFSVNKKPCIVLTNYRGYYPTLWFALIHELFHVLFDWEEIKSNTYHLTDDDNDQLSVIEKEKEADNFAREYLFSREKTEKISPYLSNSDYVNEFAKNNHVHSSFVYVFNAYDKGHRTAWALANKQNPNFNHLLNELGNPWENHKPVKEFVKIIQSKLYN